MGTPITVTQREILSLAPEVQTQMADTTIQKRIPQEQTGQVTQQVLVAHAMIEEVLNNDNTESTADNQCLKHMLAAKAAIVKALPPNATIIANPYKTYLYDNTGTINPVDPNTVVATESSALCAILLVVDGQDKVKAILDLGYQIVAMFKEVCNALVLHYDPTIYLNMMLVNGSVNQSLGLVQNVPFLIGDIMLYLQVHILHNLAYNILLGQPFNMLTQLVSQNYLDKNQTVTILDPNTGRKATVPTIP